MDFQEDLEFLDIITIMSFFLQLQFFADTQRQATNNDILINLHHDIEVVDAKLNKIMEHLEIS